MQKTLPCPPMKLQFFLTFQHIVHRGGGNAHNIFFTTTNCCCNTMQVCCTILTTYCKTLAKLLLFDQYSWFPANKKLGPRINGNENGLAGQYVHTYILGRQQYYKKQQLKYLILNGLLHLLTFVQQNQKPFSELVWPGKIHILLPSLDLWYFFWNT